MKGNIVNYMKCNTGANIMNSVLIVAAGQGKRIGGNTPKQFIKLNGKTVLSYSIDTFKSIKEISEIIIVTSKDWVPSLSSIYKDCKIVVGGDTRRKSVKKGVRACSNNTENILIHDAARPFITKKIINDCLTLLTDNDISVPLINTHDTLLNINDEIKYLNRESIKGIQTPQCFKMKKLKIALKLNYDSTDEISLFLKKFPNTKIGFTKGSKLNFKVTNKDDLFIARSISDKC